jgi:hypothetical protein
LWPIALLHGITAGTDGFALWMLAIDVACALAVAACLAWRIAPRETMASATVTRRPVTGRGGVPDRGG